MPKRGNHRNFQMLTFGVDADPVPVRDIPANLARAMARGDGAQVQSFCDTITEMLK